MNEAKNVIASLILVLPLTALADESGGVFSTNYAVNLEYSGTENTDSGSLSGSLNLPLCSYLAASLAASVGKTDGGSDGDIEYLSPENYSARSSIFLRSFEIGKVSANFGYNRTDFGTQPENVANPLDDSESYQYSLTGQYYHNDLTVSVSRLYGDSKSFEDFNSSNADLTGYWHNNTKVSADISGMDTRDQYRLSMSHQPGFLDNSTELSFSYGWGSDIDDRYTISLSYYFDILVTLKDRDRKYR